MNLIYIFGAIAVFIVVGAVAHHRRLGRIAKERGDPNICAYARSFDYRNVDTQVMRAVFEQVQKWVGNYNGKPFPVQAGDSFDDTYKIDPEDLDDIGIQVAKDLGIDIKHSENNPYYGKVKTVKELVLFLDHQRKLNA